LALSIPPGKLSCWYKHVLSGFTSISEKRRRHIHDVSISNPKGGEKINIRVPILELDNIGEHMAIDEKQIGKEIVTILSNSDTGKIAMMANTLKSRELVEAIGRYYKLTYKVKSITRDLSNSYDWFSRQVFPNAEQIADKFHIIKHVLDSMQQVRVVHRQELLRDQRLNYEDFKAKELERKAYCREHCKPYKKSKFISKIKYARNGETYLEILARSRNLLFMFGEQWTRNQKERALALFEVFPDIKKAYHLCCEFRIWYRKENVGIDKDFMRNKLKQWYKHVSNSDIEEMLNVKSMVERHEGMIINYFNNGATNAIAENVNSRIQRFFNQNKGIKDYDYFFYRLKKLFA